MTVPYPDLVPVPASSGLDVSVRVSTVKGWLEVSRWPYELHSESFASTARTQRRTLATNPYVPGTFTVNAVPDNVDETLSVWVTGDTHYDVEANAETLVSALEATRYIIERRIEDSLVLWQCFAADVQITTQVEHRHARMTLVQARVPRLPNAARSLG